jgi:hypothetical protein
MVHEYFLSITSTYGANHPRPYFALPPGNFSMFFVCVSNDYTLLTPVSRYVLSKNNLPLTMLLALLWLRLWFCGLSLEGCRGGESV